MKRQASAVYIIGTEKLDKYSYGYDYPKGFDDCWKNQLDFVEPAGVETIAARSIDFRYEGGRRLKSEPFPRLLIKEGPKRVIADFEQTMGYILVSEAFREVLESCEPSVHQFEPVSVQWQDGSLAANMYILVICNALDSVSEEHTDGYRDLIKYEIYGNQELLGTWKGPNGRRLKKPVFNLSVINSHCLWRDEFYTAGPFCSDVFKEAYEEAGLKGMLMRLREFV